MAAKPPPPHRHLTNFQRSGNRPDDLGPSRGWVAPDFGVPLCDPPSLLAHWFVFIIRLRNNSRSGLQRHPSKKAQSRSFQCRQWLSFLHMRSKCRLNNFGAVIYLKLVNHVRKITFVAQRTPLNVHYLHVGSLTPCLFINSMVVH